MKKQIAVLMAAATAVTTVAPALAHADVNQAQQVVASTIVSQVEKALNVKYKNENANGIVLPTGSKLTNAYLNSQYIVLVSVRNNQNTFAPTPQVLDAMDKAGFAALNESAYAQFVKYYMEVENAAGAVKVLNPALQANIGTPQANPADYFVVDNPVKLQTVLEKFGNAAVVQIVDKGALSGASYRTTTAKHYVLGAVEDYNTQESLNSAAYTLLSLVNKSSVNGRPTMIDSVSLETYNTDSNNKNAIVNVNFNGEGKIVSGQALASNDQTAAVLENLKTNPSAKVPMTLPSAATSTFVVSIEPNAENKLTETHYFVYFKGQTTAVDIDDVNIGSLEVKLSGGAKITLGENDDALDFTKAYTAKDAQIKLFEENVKPEIQNIIQGSNNQDVLDQIAKFGTIANTNDKAVDVMVLNGNTDVYYNQEQTPEAIELKNIYTREGGYTQAGADFVNSIIDAKMGKNNSSFNFNGTLYQLDGAINFDKAVIKAVADGYQLVLPIKVRNANDLPLDYTLRFEITGASQKDLYDILRDLQGSVNVVPGHFTKLAGTNRYGTAIAVSQEQFKPETADSVVIVGGYAQMDGLAAAPLAAAKNAPILLADPHNGLSKDTIAEIKRACNNLQNRNVYIVGGVNSVPTIVEKQLKENFGAVVLRQAGQDRNATSLAVARRLFYDGQTNGNVFVVGRDGGSDAMGVASVASYVNKEKTLSIAQQEQKQATATQDVPATSSVTSTGSVVSSADKGKVVSTTKVVDGKLEKERNIVPAKDFAKSTLAKMVAYGVLAPSNEKLLPKNSDSRTTDRYDGNYEDLYHGTSVDGKDTLKEIIDGQLNPLFDNVSRNAEEDYINGNKVYIFGETYDILPKVATTKDADGKVIDKGLYYTTLQYLVELANELDFKQNNNIADLQNRVDAASAVLKKALSNFTAINDVKTASDKAAQENKDAVKALEKAGVVQITKDKDSSYTTEETKKQLSDKLDSVIDSYVAAVKKEEPKSTLTTDFVKNGNTTVDSLVYSDLAKKIPAISDLSDKNKAYVNTLLNTYKAKYDVAVAEQNKKDYMANHPSYKKPGSTQEEAFAKAYEDLTTTKNNAQSVYDKAVKVRDRYLNLNSTINKLLVKLNREQTKLNVQRDIYTSAIKNLKPTTELNGRTVSPILVVNKTGMSRVTRDFIQNSLAKAVLNTQEENNGVLQAYIIGGENTLSTQVRKDLAVAIGGSNVTRLAGANRYATNVAVINNFYTNGVNLNKVSGTVVMPTNKILVKGAVFTSGADQYLVDSQTAGFFAADNNAPIVLTDKALTADQIDMMKNGGVLDKQRSGIYQVGGVVSADVMKNVVQLLGL